MADKNLNVTFTAKDNASGTLGRISHNAAQTEGAFGRLGSRLANLGVVSPISDLETAFSGLQEHVENSSHKMLASFEALGVGMAGVGVALIQLSAADAQSQAQLKQAIQETGNSYSDYKDRIETTIAQQEKFGHTASDTQTALTRLTEATQDPTKALNLMGVAADLAAAKHESLQEAAVSLSQVLNGNTRILKQFGINLGAGKHSSEELQGAVDQLAQRLRGQASSAADTFSGKIKALTAHVEDVVAEFGIKFGPALVAFGSTMTVVAGLMDMLATKKAKQAVADLALASAETKLAAAQERVALTSAEEGAAGGGKGLLGKGLGGLAGIGGGALGVAGGIVGGAALLAIFGSAQDKQRVASKTEQFTNDPKALAQAQRDYASLQQQIAAAQNAPALEKNGGAIKAGEIKALKDQAAELKTEIDGATAAMGRNSAAAGKDAKAVSAFSQSTHDAMKRVEDFAGSLDKVSNRYLSLAQTDDDFHKSLNDLTQAAKDNGKALSGNSDKAIANRDAIRQAAQALVAHINALQTQGHTLPYVKQKAEDYAAQLETTATKVYGNKAAVDKLLGSYHLLPKQIDTLIKLNGAEVVMHEIQAVQQAFNVTQGLARTLYYNSVRNDVPIKAHASGGYAMPGAISLVGEQGPELRLEGAAGASYIPANITRGMLGGTTVVVNITTPVAVGTKAQFVSFVTEAIAEARKRGAKVAI